MPQIMTASWFAKLGVSRGVPRGKAGYHRLREFEPGPWFNSVSPVQYLTRYRQILDGLDPRAIRDQLLGYGDVPVMLCWEVAHDCHSGSKWCHRHLAAQWLRTSPQTRHRKVCNSGNVATLGVVRASIIGFPQVGHGGGSSSFWDITFVKAPAGKQNDIAQKEAPILSARAITILSGGSDIIPDGSTIGNGYPRELKGITPGTAIWPAKDAGRAGETARRQSSSWRSRRRSAAFVRQVPRRPLRPETSVHQGSSASANRAI